MLPSAESADVLETPAPRGIDYRLLAGAILLMVAIACTWLTIDTLSARRKLRTEMAEISHVRYGMLNPDQWLVTIVPILEARIDALDLTAADRASLRPAVEHALYRLLDEVKATAGAKKPPGGGAGGFPVQGNAMMANLVVGALRPHVPEYATVVLAELGKPETLNAVKKKLKNTLADGAKNTFAHVDMRWYDYILKKHECADAGACQKLLGAEIAALESRVAYDYLAVLGSSLLAFVLLMTGRRVLRRSGTVVLLLFCIVLLAGGVFTPMVEVEARIARVGMTFWGQPVTFTDQVLYFQSKSVLEVFRALIDVGRPEMWLVGVLVLMFSVIFPVMKIFTLTLGLYRPAMLRENRLARFLGLESSKWSMADVMALAIFMTYVAFNGLLISSLGALRETGAQLVIPTDGSKVLPGYYLFIGFCLASLFLSKKLERGIETGQDPKQH
jgi:hypothetical protein